MCLANVSKIFKLLRIISHYLKLIKIRQYESPREFRTCIDYRPLNKCLKPASFPLPNIKHLFERIGNKKPDIFGVMDLTAGYHQAPLHPAHRIFTAFVCFAGARERISVHESWNLVILSIEAHQ